MAKQARSVPSHDERQAELEEDRRRQANAQAQDAAVLGFAGSELDDESDGPKAKRAAARKKTE